MNSKKPTILITGVSGMLGCALAERLQSRYSIVGFDIQKGNNLPDDVDYHEVDLTSAESVEQGLEALRSKHGDAIASVIHLAAYYDFSGEPSPLYEELTVNGTDRLLRRLQSFDVKQFIFSSTLLVHTPCEPGQTINESWPLEPKWDYPQSKVETEELIKRERGDIPSVILRIAGIYDDMCHSLPISHQIQRIYEERMTGKVYPGKLDYGQAFLHLDDLIDAVERTVDRREELPESSTFILGEPETPSYGQLQEEIGRLIHNEEWNTQKIPKTVAKAGAWVQEKLPGMSGGFIKPWMVDLADDHYAVDINAAHKDLGWEPRRRLLDTIPNMIHALRDDPTHWYFENKLELPSDLKKEAAVN